MRKMYRRTKFVFKEMAAFLYGYLALSKPRWTEIYRIFMVPKPMEERLLITMQNMNLNCETWDHPVGPGAFSLDKESKLKLSVEAQNRGDVIVVHCQGRVVYRDEAAALSRVVGEVLHEGSKLVLDLSGVSSMDSAGIGELALLQTWAQERNAELKCAAPSPVVRTLLDLTNLDSVLDVHTTLDSALESFREQQVWAD
jgi:anti-sigma B factor antagonist